MQTTSYVPSLAAPADTTIAFVRWAVAQLQLEANESPTGVWRVEFSAIDEETPPEAPLAYTFDPSLVDESIEQPVQLVQLDGEVVARLVQKLADEGIAVHARPNRQPQQVHELTGRLFAAYQVDEGSVHLAGCHLEERPFLRLSLCRQLPDAEPELVETWVDESGEPVNEKLFQDLGLDEPVHRDGPAPRIDSVAMQPMLTSARKLAEEEFADDNTAQWTTLATTIVWCKYAVGKLRFEIGQAAAEQSFEGWAMTLEAPPFHCPATGAESFELAATDDGHITARDQIDVCQATQQRVLRTELVTCAASGKLVQSSSATLCPVTGDTVLSESMATCEVCRQHVSPTALRSGTCKACRGQRSVSKDDPRLARILGQHPGFDRFRRWKMAETRDVYIVCGSTLMQQTMMVLDKQNLAPLHMAHKGRFSRNWTPLAELEREELLGSDD